MQQPKVSIITVCYNSAKTIEKTIQQVLNQNYKNIEYIIIDGKSTDRTMDIMRKYEPAFSGRMKYVSEPDGGIYDAMNKGVKMATGDIIGISNSDDWLETNAVENVVATYDPNSEAQVIYGFVANMVNGKPTIVMLPTDYGMELGTPMHHPGCFLTRSTYDLVGLYDLKFRIAADFDLLMRCKRNSKVVFTPVYALIANFACDGTSGKNTLQTNMEHMMVRHKFGMVDEKTYKKEISKMKLRRVLGYR